MKIPYIEWFNLTITLALLMLILLGMFISFLTPSFHSISDQELLARAFFFQRGCIYFLTSVIIRLFCLTAWE